MKLLNLCIACCVILTISQACVIAQRNAVNDFDESDSTKGLVIFSISTTKPAFSGYYLEVFHFENRTKEKLRLSPSFQLPDIKGDSSKIYYNAVLLPSGEYKIYGWGMEFNSGTGITTFFPMGNFSLPFAVTGGRVNYLGDYLGTSKGGRDILGMKRPTGGYFIVSSRFTEDFETIIRKWPNLDLNKTLNAVPDFGGNKPLRSLMYLKGINIP